MTQGKILATSDPQLNNKMTVVAHTTPPLDDLPASDGESLRLLGTLKLAGVNPETRTAEWSANGECAHAFLPWLPGTAVDFVLLSSNLELKSPLSQLAFFLFSCALPSSAVLLASFLSLLSMVFLAQLSCSAVTCRTAGH